MGSLDSELSFECVKLANKDTLSKSDPQVVVELEISPNVYKIIGKTEVIRDCLNPKFLTAVGVDYLFERIQRLKLTVWDIDRDDADEIGSITCTLADIMGSRGVLERELTAGGTTAVGKAGKIVCITTPRPILFTSLIWMPGSVCGRRKSATRPWSSGSLCTAPS